VLDKATELGFVHKRVIAPTAAAPAAAAPAAASSAAAPAAATSSVAAPAAADDAAAPAAAASSATAPAAAASSAAAPAAAVSSAAAPAAAASSAAAPAAADDAAAPAAADDAAAPAAAAALPPLYSIPALTLPLAGVAEPAKMALAQLTLEKLVSLVNSLRTAADKLLVFALMDATGMVRETLARFYLHGALISTVLDELTDYVLSKLNAATGGLITAPSETMDGESANLKRMERKDGYPSTLLALARVTADDCSQIYDAVEVGVRADPDLRLKVSEQVSRK